MGLRPTVTLEPWRPRSPGGGVVNRAHVTPHTPTDGTPALPHVPDGVLILGQRKAPGRIPRLGVQVYPALAFIWDFPPALIEVPRTADLNAELAQRRRKCLEPPDRVNNACCADVEPLGTLDRLTGGCRTPCRCSTMNRERRSEMP